MAKISKEELNKRKAELGKHAREELSKTEVMRFRMDPKSILRLYELAEKKRQNVGAMVRQWVVERMEAEARSGAGRSSKFDQNDPMFSTILNRLDFLESQINRLAAHK